MENEETKHETQKKKPQKEGPLTLETIQASLQKRKSETTTLKILFYTGLAVLLFGFIYTNQTLQRTQYRNLESNIRLLQNRVNHTLLSVERKLHDEIQSLDAKINGTSDFQERIQSMNRALDQLEPQSTPVGILIEKVQRNSNELSQMVQALENRKKILAVE